MAELLTFVLCVPGDGEGVGSQAGLHLRVVEVDHGTVVLDHVHFLNARDVVD
jgi:hypothetical protein